MVDFWQTWIERKREVLIGTSSVLAGMVILIVYFQSGPNALAYARAASTFQQWQADPADEKLYQVMKQTIHALPNLQKKYEPLIVQKFLETDQIHDALEMAGRSLDRLKKEAPYHAAYGETTLWIEQGQFQKALERAVTLKEQMGTSYLTEMKAGSVLYVHNLLRIACLQQALQNRPGEKAAWDELEAVLKTESRLARLILSNFKEKEVDLMQYIAEKRKAP